MMSPVPGCERERAFGQATLVAVPRSKQLERRNAIRAAVTVGVDDEQA
jgi:hypothetical protein